MHLRHIASIACAILMLTPAAIAQQGNKPAKTGPRYNTGIYHPRPPKLKPSFQAAYVGFSGGINNPAGFLGVQIDVPIEECVSLCGSFGLSTWGYKSGFEARYYFGRCNRGWEAGAGITFNSGRNGLILEGIETVSGDRTITIDQRPQTAAMITAGHFFNMGRKGRNRFHLQTGYSIPLSKPIFNQQNTHPAPLTDKGEQTVLALAPGGLIVSFGISLGTGANAKKKG